MIPGQSIVIAVDGPAASGKGTVARALASEEAYSETPAFVYGAYCSVDPNSTYLPATLDVETVRHGFSPSRPKPRRVRRRAGQRRRSPCTGFTVSASEAGALKRLQARGSHDLSAVAAH